MRTRWKAIECKKGRYVIADAQTGIGLLYNKTTTAQIVRDHNQAIDLDELNETHKHVVMGHLTRIAELKRKLDNRTEAFEAMQRALIRARNAYGLSTGEEVCKLFDVDEINTALALADREGGDA